MIQKIAQSNLKVFLLFLCLGAVLYGMILSTPFKTMDDYFSIVENVHLRDWSALPELFQTSFFGAGSYYRPLVMVTFLVEYQVAGLNVWIYNLSNILLHVGNAFFVFLIVALLWRRVPALIVGVLFLCHPLQAEAVTNIPGRSILLCAFFLLLSFYAFVRACNRERGGSPWYVLSFSSFLLALLSKESAAVLPFLLVAYLIITAGRRRPATEVAGSSSRERFCFYRRQAGPWFCLVPFLQAIIVYIFWRKYLGITAAFHAVTVTQIMQGTLTFLKAMWIYLERLILPHDLSYDSSLALIPWTQDLEIAGLVLSWLVVIGLYLAFRRAIPRLVHFAVAWVLIHLGPVSQLVPVRVSANEISTADHFLYLPLMGWLIIFVGTGERLMARWQRRNGSGIVLIRWLGSAYLIFLVLTTWQQVIYSSQQIALFKRTLERNPANSRVRHSLGIAYVYHHLYEEARREFATILEQDPHKDRTRIALGRALCDLGRCHEGLEQYDLVRRPGNYAEMLERNKQEAFDQLLEVYEAKLQEDSENAQLHYSIGVMHSRQGNALGGMKHYRRAVEIDPVYGNAIFNLAATYDYLQRREEAVVLYQRLLDAGTGAPYQNEVARDRLAMLTAVADSVPMVGENVPADPISPENPDGEKEGIVSEGEMNATGPDNVDASTSEETP